MNNNLLDASTTKAKETDTPRRRLPATTARQVSAFRTPNREYTERSYHALWVRKAYGLSP